MVRPIIVFQSLKGGPVTGTYSRRFCTSLPVRLLRDRSAFRWMMRTAIVSIHSFHPGNANARSADRKTISRFAAAIITNHNAVVVAKGEGSERDLAGEHHRGQRKPLESSRFSRSMADKQT
jgi:hypothetical protein